MTNEKTKAANDANIPLSSEIILEDEEAIGLNERIAQEISKNGIECKAIMDIGSLPIEKRSYYSHLFPMSPRVPQIEAALDSKIIVKVILI